MRCYKINYKEHSNNEKCALFLYGFPATVGSNKLTELMVDCGYTVLHPHYYGTYDSIGDFTPFSAFDTVKEIVKITRKSTVRNLKSNADYLLPKKISICIGYSFGAFVLKNAVHVLVDLENVLLISPVMSNNPLNRLCWVNENGQDHLDYVIRTRPLTYRIKDKTDWLHEYIEDRYKNNLLADNKTLPIVKTNNPFV